MSTAVQIWTISYILHRECVYEKMTRIGNYKFWNSYELIFKGLQKFISPNKGQVQFTALEICTRYSLPQHSTRIIVWLLAYNTIEITLLLKLYISWLHRWQAMSLVFHINYVGKFLKMLWYTSNLCWKSLW